MKKNKVGRPCLGKPGSHKMQSALLPKANIKKLRTLAKEEGVTIAHLIRTAVERIVR